MRSRLFSASLSPAAATIVVLAGIAVHSGAHAQTVVKIGHVAPLTGPIAHLGKDNELGARLAIEDLNARKGEELQQVLERANRVVKQVAEAEKYDLVIQEAVYINPKHDITEKVIRALNAAR